MMTRTAGVALPFRFFTTIVAYLLASNSLSLTVNSARGDDDLLRSVLIAEIKQFSERDVYLSCSIQEADSPNPEAGLFGELQRGIAKQVMTNMMRGDELFLVGKFELMVDPKKNIGLVSVEDQIPTLQFYSSETKFVCTQTHHDSPIFPNHMVFCMGKLFDWLEMSESIRNNSKMRIAKDGDQIDVRLVLDSEKFALPGINDLAGMVLGKRNRISLPINPMAPSVVDATMVIRLDANKHITRLHYELQYDDPMKEMMNGVQGQQAIPRALRGGKRTKEDEANMVLGKIVTLDLEVKEKGSEKLLTYVEKAREMLKANKAP